MPLKATFFSLATLIAVAAAGFSLIGTSNAVEDGIARADKDRIERIVKDYLVEHPEVIIEALNAYEMKMMKEADDRARNGVAEFMPALLAGEIGYVGGAKPDDAKVVVVEMFDYHCGFCKRATGLTNDLITKEKDIAVVFVELPLVRKESDYAAQIALAARDQDKYLKLHFAMMKASGVLTKSRIDGIAKKAGINVKALKKAHASKSYESTLGKSRQIANKMGIDGTPAFIIASSNGAYTEVVRGWDAIEIKQAIKAARKAK